MTLIAEMHAKDGVDFLTIHVGINKNTAERFKENEAPDQHRLPRRFHYLCMDGNDRTGEPIL